MKKQSVISIKRMVLGILLIALFTACNDFLEISPKGKTIPEKTEDYAKLLALSIMVKTTFDNAVLMTDDVYVYYIDKSWMTFGYFYSIASDKNLYTFNDEIYKESDTDALWTYSYRRINTYNIVADNVLNSKDGTESEKNVLLGEALTGRAYEYLQLINTYAKAYDALTASTDLGLPLLISGELNIEEHTRSSVQEVYNQIEEDLLNAIELLDDRPNRSVFRASKPAAYGLLARMYLFMDNYEKALKYSEKCLAYNARLLNFNDYNVVNPNSYSKRIDLPHGLGSEENIYLRMPALEYGQLAMNYVSDDLVSMFNKETDRRWALYYTNRYMGQPTERYLWVPIIYINIGVATPEMYLIAAECAARTGDFAKAESYINDFRDSRYTTHTRVTSADGATMLNEILAERRREFAFFGLNRLFDLKRLNKENRFAKTVIHKLEGKDESDNPINLTFTLLPNDNKYALPISPKVMQYSPNMEQNPR